ncbi:MAG: endonuclease MutS2, partial [Oscillospiraceae bacterium]
MIRKYLDNLELYKVVAMAQQRAACPEAKEMLAKEEPFTERYEVEHFLRQTDEMASLLLQKGNARISSCESADTAVRRTAKGGILSMGELLLVCGALRNFSALHSWFGQSEAPGTLDDIFFTIIPQPSLENDIRDAILSETEMADNASDELYQLRRKIRQAESSIREKLDSIIKNQNNSKFLQESIVSLRNGRYVVPVKAESRSEIGGVIHDVSSSGGTLFVEPTAVVEANAKILQLKNQEKAEIERILAAFSERIGEFAPSFFASYSAMLQVDVCMAKAELGLSMRGIRPLVQQDMAFNLVKARHPLLDKDTVVPVDIELGNSYDTLIVTGPNTGGKTVSLKTAGLLCAMAQMGYLIPAHDTSSICMFGQFLIDIGDEQSIEQSLSTFSGHMKNITEILKLAGPTSLVLMDELGAGTDPSEGAALAVSIIEELRHTKARIMATTHYAEMKMYALEIEGVQNAGSEFDVETLRPTYRLIVGVPGRSNAFLISEKLGVPQTVIENARRHMSSEQRRFETVLGQLEDLKREHKRQQEEIEQLRYTAAHQLEEAKEKRDALIRQGEDELQAARQKAKNVADDVQNAAYSLLDEIKRMEKDERKSLSQKAQRAREIAKQEAGQLSKRTGTVEGSKISFVPLMSVRVGQSVYLPLLNKQVAVTALPDKAGLVEVRMGAVKTKLPLMEISALPKNEKETAK